MFWRFGSLDDRRPVAATAWLNEVCSRPVARVDQRRQRVDVRPLQLREHAVARRSSRASGAAPPAPPACRRRSTAPVLVLRTTGSHSFPNRTSAELLGRVDVERPPASAWISVSSAASCSPTSSPISRSRSLSSWMPRTRCARARARAAAPCPGRADRAPPRAASPPAAAPAPAPPPPPRPGARPTSSTEMSAPGISFAPVPIQLPAAGGRRHALAAADDVEVVARARRVEQIRRQHRIRRDPAERQPAAQEQHLQRLGVVDVLRDLPRRQQRRQRRQRLRLGRQLGAPR